MSNSNKFNWTILDIEPMLLSKPLTDLTPEEMQFLQQHLGSWEQIKAYHQFLSMNHSCMDAQDYPEIEPDPMIQQRLRRKLKPQKTYRNGFESIGVALWGLFKVSSPLQTGMVAAMLAVCFWMNSTVNDFNSPHSVFANDSLTMQSAGVDSSVFFNRTNTHDSMSDSAYQWKHNNQADSFLFEIKGILRQ